MPVRLTIANGPHAGVARAEIKRRADAMLACLQLDKSELSLVLSDDDQLHELNKLYRGKDKPTDVLAFAMREGDFGRLHAALPGALLGDVIVSVPTARRQAREAQRPLIDELTMLVAHGLLHLLGWDHDTAAKDRAMRAETQRLCDAADGAVDARPARAPRPSSPRARPAVGGSKRAAAKGAPAAKRRSTQATNRLQSRQKKRR